MANPTLTIAAGILAAGVTAGAGALTWRFGYFFAPFRWTGEPQRLAALLKVGPGSRVADIGAGDGAMAAEFARIVGERGAVFATDIDAARRDQIARRATADGIRQLTVVEASPDAPNLPAVCCDALYMRFVYHHIADPVAYARHLAGTVRPGGRIAVIDFAPGLLWFHDNDHGVRPETIEAAFAAAGCELVTRDDAWGGGTFVRVLECPARPR
jgi:ubiquinone/menaquinone biosynthesis C-methylase UbiE